MLKTKIFRFFRVSEWYDSKIPFMLFALCFFEIKEKNINVYFFTKEFFAFLFYIVAFFAFSYVINDVSDIEADRIAGKDKVIFSVSHIVVVLTLIGLPILGNFPLLLVAQNKLLYVIISVLIYMGGIAYSVPFLRFKEKGMPGLIECTIAQRCLPLTLLFVADVYVEPMIFAFIEIVSFANGLRYILIHQLTDLENDKKSGIATYISCGNGNYEIAIKLCFILEAGISTVILGFIPINIFLKLFLALLYIIFENTIRIVVSNYMEMDWMSTFLAVPLESLLNVFFPVLIGFVLLQKDIKFVLCFVVIVLFSIRCFFGKFAFITVYIRDKMVRRKRL